MFSGVVASIICPSCGQPFLCQQQAAAGMVSCPHCAHQGPRAQFQTQGQAAGVPSVRRRVSRPLQEAPPQPQAAPQPIYLPPEPPPQQPSHWNPPPNRAPEAQVWRQPTAQTPVAMQPVQTYSEAAQEAHFVPHHLQRSPMRWIGALMALLAVVAAGGWIWWDLAQGHSISITSASTAPRTASPAAEPPAPEPEVRKAEIATQAESMAATQPPPDVAAITSDTKRLIDELFGADTPERRLACVHEGSKYAEQVEALLSPDSPQRPTLHMLGSIKGLSQVLPGGAPCPLFQVVTSTCGRGAMIRLLDGADGVRRIDWPLFFETHQQTLLKALQESPGTPVWAWARLVLSHGFELPAEERTRFLAFQMHLTADGKSPIVACVERDTPLGRLLGQETDWRRSYLARLLVRRSPMESSTPILVIVDCEGAQPDAAFKRRSVQ